VQFQELRPAHTHRAALRRGSQVVATEEVAHRQLIDMMPEIRQGTLAPSIAPGRIVCGHLA